MAEERGGERWLKKSGYGLMFHYEAFRKHSAQSYNEAVDSFDVNRFVNAVADTNAGHVVFVIGQHWGDTARPTMRMRSCWGLGTGFGPRSAISSWKSGRSLRSGMSTSSST